jgi:hypothetical protein
MLAVSEIFGLFEGTRPATALELFEIVSSSIKI